jgi:hypothetical protein
MKNGSRAIRPLNEKYRSRSLVIGRYRKPLDDSAEISRLRGLRVQSRGRSLFGTTTPSWAGASKASSPSSPRRARRRAAPAKNLGTGVLAARPAGWITDREAKKGRQAAAKLVSSRAFKLALSDAVGWLYSREIYREAL